MALVTVAIAMAIYQLVYTQVLLQSPTGHRITHLGFALAVVFLSLMLRNKGGWHVKLALLIVSMVVTGYLMFFLHELLLYRTATPETSDLIIGGLAIFLSLAASYLIYGKTFPIVALAAIAYLVLGRYLPFPFTVAAVSLKRLLMWLSVSLGTDEGIYGSMLGISANYLFLFIFFGGLLHAFGGTRFIMAVGRWVGSKLRSGPAAVALVGSSLLGTVTGSTVANITITGAFTIPMMKKAGYRPEQAGAIEAVSSNGGQIMPPIMGATAFVMAGFAGIPYIQIMVAAIVPALLYYFVAFFYVQLTAEKTKVQPILEPVSGKQLLLDAPLFFLPLGVLLFLLVRGYTLPYVGFWSIITLIAVGLISNIRKEARLHLKEMVDGITGGVRTASEIAIVLAVVGVVATAIKVSGVGIKLPLLIGDISHGSVLIALLIAMLASILLGMGVPTAAAYLLVAIGAVPALLAMGVPLLQAHFFCFFFAVFSHLTPPVAIGALVASKIADADYWKTAWEAIKAGFAAFLLPFFIIYAPVIILRPDVESTLCIAQIVAILLAVTSLQMGISNYCFTYIKLDERVAFIIAAALCLTFIFSQIYPFLFAGAALLIANIIRQIGKRQRHKTLLEVST